MKIPMIPTIINFFWMKNIERRFKYVNNIYATNISKFHELEHDSIRTIKNSFNFFLHHSKNRDRVEQELETLEHKVFHRINM